MFDKKVYRANRSLGKRGQGEVEKPNFVESTTTKVFFINNKPTKLNRKQLRDRIKAAKSVNKKASQVKKKTERK